jgi:hypothetical protein
MFARHSTTQLTPQPFFSFTYLLAKVSHFWPPAMILLPIPPMQVWFQKCTTSLSLLVEMRSCYLFSQEWPWTMMLQIPTLWVPGIKVCTTHSVCHSFLWLNNIPPCVGSYMCTTDFIHWSINAHLAWFYVLAIVSSSLFNYHLFH